MSDYTISIKNPADNAPGAKVPILWALLALSYLFEIGAIAVIINTKDDMQMLAACAAIGFPLFAMVVVALIRIFGESFFYTSPEFQGDIVKTFVQSEGQEASDSTRREELKKIIDEILGKGGQS